MRINELLNIEFPIFQGGMANIATGEFAAAVSNAGALGTIGAGGMDAETLREHIKVCKSLTLTRWRKSLSRKKLRRLLLAPAILENTWKAGKTQASKCSP